MNDEGVRAAVAEFVEEGELVVSAVVVLSVVDDQDRVFLRMATTDMPWWNVEGMLSGAREMMIDGIDGG